MAIGSWQNADGLTVRFPAYYADPANFVNKARLLSTMGHRKVLVIDYDLSLLPAATTSFTSDLNNDGTPDGFNTGDIGLPIGASVLSVILVTSVAAVGGTSITLGTYNLAGGTVSATSLITATEGAIANLDTVGARTYGAGALVSASAEAPASSTTIDTYLGLTTAGTFSAGKGRIFIEYLDVFGDL